MRVSIAAATLRRPAAAVVVPLLVAGFSGCDAGSPAGLSRALLERCPTCSIEIRDERQDEARKIRVEISGLPRDTDRYGEARGVAVLAGRHLGLRARRDTVVVEISDRGGTIGLTSSRRATFIFPVSEIAEDP